MSGAPLERPLPQWGLVPAIVVVLLVGAQQLYALGHQRGADAGAACAATCQGIGGGAGHVRAGLCACEQRPLESAEPSARLPCDLVASGVCYGSPYVATWPSTRDPQLELERPLER